MADMVLLTGVTPAFLPTLGNPKPPPPGATAAGPQPGTGVSPFLGWCRHLPSLTPPASVETCGPWSPQRPEALQTPHRQPGAASSRAVRLPRPSEQTRTVPRPITEIPWPLTSPAGPIYGVLGCAQCPDPTPPAFLLCSPL